MERHSWTTWTTLAVFGLAALLATAGCEREPSDTGLVKDMETLLPAEPEVPETAVEAPEHTEIVHADELVSLVRITLEPGERVPEHDAPYRVLYAVSGGDLEIGRGGEVETVPLGDGEVVTLEPGTYSVANVGDEPVELIAAARTDAALPVYAAAEEPEEDGGAGRVLLANDRVRVRVVDVGPDETVPLEPVPIRVVYTPATAVTLEYTTAAGDTVPVSTAVSQGHARPGDDQSVAVQGASSPVRLIMFEWLA